MRQTRLYCRRAFTLVELLVVIGIISVLVAILLPALARARMQAQIVVCASNMRQVGIALVSYANDNKGRLPPNGGSDMDNGPCIARTHPTPPGSLDLRGLAKYMGNTSVMMCPGLFAQAPLINGEGLVFWWNWYGMGVDDWINNTADNSSRRIGYQYMTCNSQPCSFQDTGVYPPCFKVGGWYPTSFSQYKFNEWWILSDRAVCDSTAASVTGALGNQYKFYMNVLPATFAHAGKQPTGGNILWGDWHVEWMGMTPWRVWSNGFIYAERNFSP